MKSLRSKLLLAHSLVLVVAFGLLWILLSKSLYPIYLNRVLGRQMLERGAAVAAKIAPLLEKHDIDALNQELDLVKASMGAEVCLVNVDRKVLAHAELPEARGGQPPLNTCCPDLSLHKSNESLTTRHAGVTACGRDIVVAAIPVYSEPAPNNEPGEAQEATQTQASIEPQAILLIRLPLSDIHSATRNIGNIILICGFTGLLIALATALLLSERIAGPLQRMRKMAAGMAKGNFTGRIQAKGKDEVRQLADSFNSLAEQLHTSLVRLEDESAKLRGVMASMAEGVLAIGSDQSILLFNPQVFATLNLPQCEISGKTLRDAGFPQELQDAFRESLTERRMVAKELSTAYHTTSDSTNPHIATSADSTDLHIASVDIVPMHLGQGEWGAVAVMRDISEARRMEEMRRRFFSDISHELRTPLTNITGYAAALEDGTAADPPTRARALTVILKESERLRRFIDDLLDLSRLESGEPNLQKEWCDIAPIAAAAVEALEYTASQADVTLHLDIPKDLPQVFADPDRLSQVFVNLISNAIHFNHPGGEVILSACARNSEIEVTIRDTGVGINADEVPYVWERFYRATPDEKRGMSGTEHTSPIPASEPNHKTLLAKGSGLGLAIVRRIVQAHNGRVWVESTPKHGSTFGFALPID